MRYSGDSIQTNHRGEVLVVDDESSIQEIERQILEIEGYRVWTATNGLEAIEQLTQMKDPCAILLDLMMPVMNGFEFLEIRKQDARMAKIPVIVVSAFTETKVPENVEGFVHKPVDLDLLLSLLERSCRKKD